MGDRAGLAGTGDELAVVAGLADAGVLADGDPVQRPLLHRGVELGDVALYFVGGDLHPDFGVGTGVRIGEGHLAEAAQDRRAHAHRLRRVAAARL